MSQRDRLFDLEPDDLIIYEDESWELCHLLFGQARLTGRGSNDGKVY